MKTRALLLISIAIAGCQSSRPLDDPRLQDDERGRLGSERSAGLIVKGPGFTGIIFSAKPPPDPRIYPSSTGFWTPSESDVSTAEERLVPFLKNSNNSRIPEIVKRLDKYKRQYRGVVLRGRKQIAIHFFCDSYEEDWKVEEVVADGGSCFFNLHFSIEDKTFSDLEINGFA